MKADVKPGTRCECRVLHNKHLIHATQPWSPAWAPKEQPCQREAVRLVTVRDQKGIFSALPRLVPMCAACEDAANEMQGDQE